MTITGKAVVAGVMGWPVGHSRSPLLHNFWLARAGIDGVYVPFAVPPEKLREALRALPALGFAGTNVTIPHKEDVFAAVDDVKYRIAATGARMHFKVRICDRHFSKHLGGQRVSGEDCLQRD